MTKEQWMHMYNIIGAAQEVYNELGPCMAEPIYQEAMEIELGMRNIPCAREVTLHTWYKGIKMKKIYIADFMSKDVVIEFKSVSKVTSEHRAQLFNYLHITNQDRGILINYGEDHFHSERYVFDTEKKRYELITRTNLKKYIDG